MNPLEGYLDWICGNGVDQTDLESPRGGDLLSGNKKFQRASLTDQSRKPLGAAPSGDQAKRGASMSEHGMWRRNSPMACEREIKSSAHTMTFDGGCDKGGILRDRIHQCLPHLRKTRGLRSTECGDFVQVSTHRKEFVVASDDKWSTAIGESLDDIREGEHAGTSQAIHAVDGGQPQNMYVVAGGNFKVLGNHEPLV